VDFSARGPVRDARRFDSLPHVAWTEISFPRSVLFRRAKEKSIRETINDAEKSFATPGT
jgi:hypothetical protein